MENIWLQIKELVAMYGLNILAAIGIFIVGKLVASGARKMIRKVMGKRNVDATLSSFVGSILYIGILGFTVIAALSKLGIQTASFVAVLGAAGLAIGLALQGSLSNFASGVLMVIFKPFKGGDFIEAGGASGFVDGISIFTTTIRTIDNKKVIIPNSKIMGDNIINYTARETRRVDLTAGISYGDDIDKAKEVLMGILREDERILSDPPPFVGLSEMADSSVNFTVRGWVRTEDYWAVFFDTNEKIKKALDAAGISIPFPQRDIHIIREN